MLNKLLLLACCNGSDGLSELVCRIKLTVAYLDRDYDIDCGYSVYVPSSSCEIVEVGVDGDVEVLTLMDSYDKLDDEWLTQFVMTDIGVAPKTFVNETTGAVAKVLQSGVVNGDYMAYLNKRLFEGFEAGQECVIAIYK